MKRGHSESEKDNEGKGRNHNSNLALEKGLVGLGEFLLLDALHSAHLSRLLMHRLLHRRKRTF